MYIIWIILTGLIIGLLAVPLAREFGYNYGRFGRLTDIFFVMTGALIFGVVFVGVLTAIGASIGGDTGAIVLGVIGAFVAVVLLTVFSTKAAVEEDQLPHGSNRPDN